MYHSLPSHHAPPAVRCSTAGETCTAATPLGPRCVQHSAATSSQCHWNSWTTTPPWAGATTASGRG
eukprot:1081854-Prymnesium_polylepis.1